MTVATSSKKQPRPVAGAIESVISSFGLATSYNGWMVVQRWEEIVGEQIAKRAHAFRYSDGVLYVAVKDSAWRQNLSMELGNIMGHVRSYPFGRVIKEIRLVASERGL